MGEIKSARELAAEKVEKLGGLSTEEQRRLKEQEWNTAGSALAERFLISGDEQRLEDRLRQYPVVADREMVARAVLVRLAQTLDLGADGVLESLSRAAAVLPQRDRVAPVLDRVREVFEQYRQVESEARSVIDREGRETLHRMRIGGSAVGEINTRARPEWRARLKELALPLAQQLEELKQELATI